MAEVSKYKDTLNLPQTSFPMKASLAAREAEMLRAWETGKVYQALRERASKAKSRYILHDGPPYANGHIHIGHALNKILKDIIVKYKTMKGFDSLYVPGWDCHGLPIEHQCLKDMGKRKDEVERVAFRRQARAYAEKFIGIQREEFKRLGVFGEWEKPYRTMDFRYQAEIARSLLDLYEKGYIEQRKKPVPWCWDCETALADAELEYEDRVDKTVYVKFRITGESLSKLTSQFPDFNQEDPVYFLVWTTTPWTLPANVGIALNPDLKYQAIKVSGVKEVWILAENRSKEIIGRIVSEPTQTKAGHTATEIFADDLTGKNYKGLEYIHPFLPYKGRVILADYVKAEDGTGIVHIAPGHGEEDYQEGHLKNRLEVISPVDEKGRFTKEFPACEDIHVFKANEKIIEILKEKGALLHTENVQHSYPHCWRCKKPIIFRATPQWFLKMDHQDLRKKMGGAIQSEIRFTPDWGKNRIGSMVETRPDWCLSRQRYWGVPVPLIRCQGCGKVFASETKEKILSLFKERGADAWFEEPVESFFKSKPACCKSPKIKKEEDIIDVWFDSGVSHRAVLKEKEFGLRCPADLYLEGSDQHRGWFQSALTTAMALEGRAPFRGVLTHGFVMDGEGKKMSKSAGNVVAPQDVMKDFGADILRLWVSSCDYQFDVRLSKEILNQMADAYRKIRNTFRYMLANLFDFSPGKDAVPFKDLHPLDQWAVWKADKLVGQVDAAFEDFRFHQIYRAIQDFCVIDLSSYYFDILKDILYTENKNSKRRRSAQTALYHILNRLVRLIAPILPFTADEIWRVYPLEPDTASVHGADFVVGEQALQTVDSKRLMEWDSLRSLRDAVTPFLEEKREKKEIGSSLDAKVSLKPQEAEAAEFLNRFLKDLPRVFIVSQVEILPKPAGETGDAEFLYFGTGNSVKIGVGISRAAGKKCVRCWNYQPEVGSNAQHPELCGKCLEAIR